MDFAEIRFCGFQSNSHFTGTPFQSHKTFFTMLLWLCGVVVITTAQLHATKPNIARGVSEVCDKDLRQTSWVEIKLTFSSVNDSIKMIYHHY